MPERSFGKTIKSRRSDLGLSQAKLGELVGRSAATVRSWERDSSHPTDTTVISALSAVLGIDEQLLYDSAGESRPAVETSPTVEQALASLSPVDTPEIIEESSPEEPTAVQAVEEPPVPAITPSTSQETFVTTTTTPPVGEPSYLEDPSQRRLYQARTIATIAILVALGVAFLWALSEGLGSLGAWWDEFFGNLRL